MVLDDIKTIEVDGQPFTFHYEVCTETGTHYYEDKEYPCYSAMVQAIVNK